MSKSPVIITDISLRKNPAYFLDRFVLDITFEASCPGIEELIWKLVYVGSAGDPTFDQVLESVVVGPVYVGRNMFTLKAKPPEMSKIPIKDLLGATVLLLSTFYKDREFIRIGWYVNNEYEEDLPLLPDDEDRSLTVPEGGGTAHHGPLPNYDYTNFNISKVKRNVLCAKPRISKIQIEWDGVKFE